jgi:AcrR family transcriptional regulator
VATEGMDAVTIRHVARQAGFKSAVISHYFKDKREMLNFTLESIRKMAAERVETGFQDHLDLGACFEHLLCTEADSLLDWQVWFGFWGKTTFDSELASIRERIVEATDDYLERVLEGAKQRGELPKTLDCGIHAQRLQMVFNGIAALVIINPKAWPPEAQRAVLGVELTLMKTMPTFDLPD